MANQLAHGYIHQALRPPIVSGVYLASQPENGLQADGVTKEPLGDRVNQPVPVRRNDFFQGRQMRRACSHQLHQFPVSHRIKHAFNDYIRYENERVIFHYEPHFDRNLDFILELEKIPDIGGDNS